MCEERIITNLFVLQINSIEFSHLYILLAICCLISVFIVFIAKHITTSLVKWINRLLQVKRRVLDSVIKTDGVIIVFIII